MGIGNDASTTASVWIDDSIAGLSYRNMVANDFVYFLSAATGTRHLVIRMSNSTKSGSWDVFVEGSTANGCVASIQNTT